MNRINKHRPACQSCSHVDEYAVGPTADPLNGPRESPKENNSFWRMANAIQSPVGLPVASAVPEVNLSAELIFSVP
jgi:hypothetical protein